MVEPSDRSANRWGALALTLGISAAGGALAQVIGMPAGLLMGGALAVSIATLGGLETHIPTWLRDSAFVVVGMTLGTNVAQDSLTLMAQWPLSLVGLAVALALIVSLSTLSLRYVFGFDKATAYLSSFPGHLSFVIGIAESGYGNGRLIALTQSVRILMLTIFTPLLARAATSTEFIPIGAGTSLEPWVLIILATGCVAGGFAFRQLRVPAAFILGSMVVATLGKLAGFYDGRLPVAITGAGYVVMGGLIGSRFSRTTMADLKSALLGGLATTTIAVLTVAGIAALVTHFTDLPFGQVWLGLAPGGLETMGALGIALGFDTAFIAAHHTARFFLLSLAIPSVALLAGRRDA